MAVPKYPRELHLRVDDETVEKIDECIEADRERLMTCSPQVVSASSVVRDAIDMYHRARVRQHTIVSYEDPRYR